MVAKEILEEWKIYKDYSDYRISNLGRVRSLARIVNQKNGGKYPVKNRILTPYIDEAGYAKVNLYKNGKAKFIGVNILVCTCFHGPRPSKLHHAAHWDGITLNNRYDNLRWATAIENIADKKRHNTIAKGEKSGTAQLTNLQVSEIKRLLRDNLSIKDLSHKYAVSYDTIWLIKQGRTWSWLQ